MVKMYFKNEKRSGGGKIVRSSFERGVAFFTFENAEVTERVLARKTHTFDGHQLDVRMFDDTSYPPLINQNSSVIISNIPEEVTADTEYMTSYFNDEDTFGEVLRVKTVDFDTEKRNAIVEFVDETAVELVLEHQPLYMGRKLNRLCIEKYSTRETNTETTCIIEVNGPSHLIKQDNLKMLNAYFNSTERSGGGKVIKSSIENGCAYFTFETGEVARRVASKRNHSLKKGPLDVRIFEGYISHKRALSSRSRSKTIEVHSIDEKALETMQLYFENSKRSGGGHIIDCKMDSRRNCAFFTFEKKNDARNVAARNHCKFGVDVKLLDDEMDEGSPMNMTKNLHENTKTVKVMNVGRDIKGETLQFYFENTSRSGGGEIESITRYDDDDQLVYYITFVSEKDAVSVSAKSHLVQEHTLRVMLYVQPPAYENKLLIKGLSEKTTKEGLEHYLEATACLQPVSISFSDHDDDIALVTFKSKPDFEKVTNVCQSRPLDGAELRISKVPVSNCIFVSNIATDVTEDTVMFYFENTNKSGGGTVEKVTFNRPEGTCLVYFADYKVIEEVISRNHELSRQSLTVNRYLACLKGFESNVERKLVIPGPLYVAFSDVDGLPYLSKTGKMAELVEEELRKHHTTIIWPLGKEDKHVKLECILTKDVSRCYQLAKNWEMQSKKCLIDMMNQFSLRRIDILQVVWQRVIDFVKTIKIENPQNVSLFYENENPIVVFGRPDAVEYVDEAIKSKVDELTRDEVEKIEQKTYYSQIKLKFMIKHGIKEDILKQFNDLRIHTDDTSGEIAFIGPVRSVSKATAFTSKLSRSLFTRTLENVSDRALNLYKSKEATNYIQKKLKDNNKYCVFDVVDNTVLTCGKDKTMLEDCIKLIEESVLECEIKCQRDHVPDFKSESWERLVASILANNEGKVEICLPDDTEYVLVCTTDDLKDDVCKEIQNFILSHTIKSRRISHSPEESKFIATYRQRELDKIATGLSKFYVEIKAINYNSFEFCGLDEGVNIAIKEFEALADSVKRRRHKVQKLGIRDHITSPKGNEILHTIEKTLECVIVVEEEARWKITEGCNVLAECEAFLGRKIYACLGDITNIKTDVLVNPQDEDMTFSGRLGSVICSKGGPSIQRSCNGHGKLKKGDVFICDGGKLKAKYTANVRSQSWTGGQNEEEKLLTMTICKCLHESSLKQTAKSIAFPAVGCGSNGFPADVTARCLVKAIRTYFQDNKESQIDTIFLCDKTMRTVTGFSEALSSEFGYKNVIKHDIQVEYEAKATGTQLQQHGDITNSMPSKSKVSRRKRMSAENRITGNKSAKHSGGSKSGDDFRYGGVKISIIKGNIAEQRVDVIVNTASRNLDLSQGAVSKSILTAGGVGLKKEIATKYPKGISGTNVAITSGHKLNCSILIHIALDQFDANNVTGSMNDLHEVIGNCFKEAQRSHHSSIVLPAMGTGNLGYPRDLVAKELFVSALDFCKQNPRTSISDIIFIVHPSDTASIQV
ncbi:protein mono-ADP-ribosyltransferase PARP14-like [Mercenaria mercenaria]|uniref:protein mono-ADP-ribosyltransferase PARP14-like n=1 Tax=Mercenaria mercenaria TaxID=6596 RepID=UPI00234FB0D6|nr:protein mono-ADP-ribosyltransferase PARP14-like [Mercenaria mercenaria]